MRVAATNVLPGDIVRGIGLVVEYSEPHTDFHTDLVGYVSTRCDDVEGGYLKTATKIFIPNDHVVNVRRSDANFRADRIGRINEAVSRFLGGSDILPDEETPAQSYYADLFISRIARIARAPRGRRFVTDEQVVEVLGDADPSLIDPDELLDALDALEPVDDMAVVAIVMTPQGFVDEVNGL